MQDAVERFDIWRRNGKKEKAVLETSQKKKRKKERFQAIIMPVVHFCAGV